MIKTATIRLMQLRSHDHEIVPTNATAILPVTYDPILGEMSSLQEHLQFPEEEVSKLIGTVITAYRVEYPPWVKMGILPLGSIGEGVIINDSFFSMDFTKYNNVIVKMVNTKPSRDTVEEDYNDLDESDEY